MNSSLYNPKSAKNAFVSATNGISGYAIVEHLIRTPKSEWYVAIRVFTFPRLQHTTEFLAADFLAPQEETAARLMHGCEDVMHAFLTSYVHMDDFSKLRDMIENFIDVIGSAKDWPCSQHYGAHLGPTAVPLTEKIPRYEGHGLNFCYTQEDDMFVV
ncbi:putative nucleoside-diphosphate-sugar epimerase protein [Lasiodiplodia theobromae]|nr:putative nucleoside-diphosphate-sugar epimerase protein [Lasiodiplodia theobromae]